MTLPKRPGFFTLPSEFLDRVRANEAQDNEILRSECCLTTQSLKDFTAALENNTTLINTITHVILKSVKLNDEPGLFCMLFVIVLRNIFRQHQQLQSTSPDQKPPPYSI